MVTQQDIAKTVGLDVSSVNKILNRVPGPVFRRETIKAVFQIVHPLSPGEHTLYALAEAEGIFSASVTYHLTVR